MNCGQLMFFKYIFMVYSFYSLKIPMDACLPPISLKILIDMVNCEEDEYVD